MFGWEINYMETTDNFKEIISDRGKFSQFVYTPFSEALKILEERRKDKELEKKVLELLKDDIPSFISKDRKHGVLFRHIATPNNETKYFLALVKDSGLDPVICEYLEDIFSPDSNEYKHSLAKMRIHKDPALLRSIFEKEHNNIVDFNENKGKKIKDVLTKWNEPLVDFHRNLLKNFFSDDIVFWDSSNWCVRNGKAPSLYYKKFFLLFVYHGILFDNFLFNKEEIEFSEKIILPAIQAVIDMTGVKPLIVPIAPIELEELDGYWLYYPSSTKKFIKDRIKNNI